MASHSCHSCQFATVKVSTTAKVTLFCSWLSGLVDKLFLTTVLYEKERKKERGKKDDENGLLQRLASRLPLTVMSFASELLGSIILSTCLLWGL